MAGVFLSYDRDDSQRARFFARVLEKAGHNVWWDLHIRGGTQFGKVIEEALEAADAVVVLWSANSIESAWVKDEAAAGRDSGRLVPVTIDGTDPPLGFRQFQTIDLSRWRGRGRPPALDALLNDVAAMGGRSPAGQAPPSRPTSQPAVRWDWRIVAAAPALVGLAAALFLWSPWAASGGPTLVVRAAAADPGSQALARDVAVKLASLQGIKADSLRLVSESDGGANKPSFTLDVTQTPASGQAAATLVLTNAKDGTVIWSDDFANSNLADLKQQIALSAARVIGCAGEATDPRQGLKDQQVFRLYLNSCAQLADVEEPTALIAALQQVAAKAPRFAPAWSKLIVVESEQVDDEDPTKRARDASMLRRDIAGARAIDPDMPEAMAAEASLLPAADVAGKMRILDRAKADAPDNPAVLLKRSDMLRNVGRMRDGIEDSSRAAQLDPLSPAARSAYVDSLAYAGQIDGARQELDAMERLWPGSSKVKDLVFRFNLRFGDPRIAMPEAQKRALLGIVLYLGAREDPGKIDPYIQWLTARRDYSSGRLGVLVQAFGEFHREDQLFQVLFSWPNPADLQSLWDIWFRPALNRFRHDPRFIQVMARTPLLKYWRTSGRWPDFCYAPDLSYDCARAAAKIGSALG